MIGLRCHRVKIVESDPEWCRLGEEVCTLIRSICVALPITDVQHVGSTSVSGLPAKPILDVAVAIPNADVMPELVERLTNGGFICRGDTGNNSHLFVRESEPEVHTIHIHIIAWKGDEWRNFLNFRDILRKNSTVRQQYADLKLHLRDKFQNDRKSYTASKSDFIRCMLHQASGNPF